MAKKKPEMPRPKCHWNFPCFTCGGNKVCTKEYPGGITYHGVCPDCEGSGLQGGMDVEQHKREGYYDNVRW